MFVQFLYSESIKKMTYLRRPADVLVIFPVLILFRNSVEVLPYNIKPDENWLRTNATMALLKPKTLKEDLRQDLAIVN